MRLPRHPTTVTNTRRPMRGAEPAAGQIDASRGRTDRPGELDLEMSSSSEESGRGRRLRAVLLLTAAVLIGVALFQPLWGMTLVSVQYPEGLRMVVYPLRLVGDLNEINMLNGYIGMADISREYFVELRILPLLFGGVILLAVLAAFVDHVWATALPFVALAATAAYGLWSMNRRLYDYGHDLDPMAPMDVAPFTPPMIGENQIAQFGTYAWFGPGAYLPAIAALLIVGALWLDLGRRRSRAG